MPIYEYKLLEACPFCEERFERIQNIGEAPLGACELCGIPCRRLISKPAIKKCDRGHGGVWASSNLERQGMARWERCGSGVYEGPRYLLQDGSVSD